MTDRWRPTHALVRAGLVSSTLAVLAVLTGRPDLTVLLAAFLLHAVLASLRRPEAVPAVVSRPVHASLREGEGSRVRIRIDHAEGVEHAAAALGPHRWLAYRPVRGVVGRTSLQPQDRLELEVAFASQRWGRRTIGDGVAGTTSAWAGYRWGPADLPPTPLTTLPAPGAFDSRAPVPHPVGLVGVNPSRRPGDGSELSSIRPFTAGDRLRRVQWRVSLRTGTLHVTSTLAEQDSSVLLVVDAGVEVGVSGGVGGAESSLDVAVRAAGAVAEHYLHRGDRVGLRVLGSTPVNAVRAAAGHRQLRRVLDTLARVAPGDKGETDPARMRFQVAAGAVVIVFSPMLSERAVVATTTLARRGLSVVVVDTLPADVDLGDVTRTTLLAWRMRRLERELLLARITRLGVPIVAWHGPGSLDAVLRRLARRAALPALVRR
jgi:uncharacterized protein (DUF58 family)